MGKQLGRKNNKRKLKWILAGIVIALLLAVALGLLVRAWSMGLLMK